MKEKPIAEEESNDLFEITLPDLRGNELILTEYTLYPPVITPINAAENADETALPEPIPVVMFSINDMVRTAITQEQASHLIMLLQKFVNTGKLI